MNDWELDYFNTKQAFLKLQEDVYMRQPPGFEPLDANFQKLVCQLLSSLYRLKQTAYDWYELLHDVLTWLDFLHCKADYAIFVFDHVSSKGMRVICIIVWHVNNGLIGANNRAFLDQIKAQIAKCFGITGLGVVRVQFVRNQVTCELWMHQGDYITYLLEEYGIMSCNLVHSLMDPNFPFGHLTDVHPQIDDLQTKY
jgi:hypothetical protein